MMKARNTALPLLGLLVLAGIVSCGGTAESQVSGSSAITTAAETETETADTSLHDSLPEDLDFGGEAFHVFAPSDYGGESIAEDATGDVLNDAQYQVQQEVCERLNITMDETTVELFEMTTAVSNLIMSGDTTYDSITMMDRFALTSAMSGCFIPLQDLQYIDLTREYWGGELSKSLTIDNQGYFAVSSFNLKSFSNTACVLVNTTMAAQNDIVIPYDSVDSGTWTFDQMITMSKGIAKDLNGDGVMDRDDVYGIGAYDRRSIPAVLWISAGVSAVSKDADDMPYNSAIGNERMYSVLQDAHDFFFSGSDTLSVTYDTDQYEPYKYSSELIFSEGRMLILVSAFKAIENLRDMADDFTVLPMPKYDESESDYHSRAFDSMFTMVPVTAENTDFSGAVLEAWSCAAYNTVLPAYIETTLQDKYARNPESARMINIAFSTRTIDIGEAYLFDYFGDQVMYTALSKSSVDIASLFEKSSKSVDKKLADIVSMFTELEK